MTRARAMGALAALAMALAVTPAEAGGGETTFVGVRNGMTEFSFALSRTKVSPGPAVIQYRNTGEDPHDFNLKRRGADKLLALGELKPLGVGSLSLRLKRSSRYVMWCSLEGHREAGMEAELKVSRR